MVARLRIPILGALWVLSGCGDATKQTTAKDAGTSVGCGAGETAIDAGGCQPAGVPPDRCGAGFASDDRGGCVAVLPPDPCGTGQTAVPGEAECHDVAPCADGTWGDIPVDATTEFVDAAYAGTGSDGTQQKPWKTIAPAAKAAKAGAVIAIAAGSYAGDVSLQDKPVRLWGRCPGLVEIVGDGSRAAAVIITTGATGTEVRDLAVTGPLIGVGVSGSQDVVVDRIWIHDTGGYGFATRPVNGATSATLSRSLIEGAGSGSGIVVSGSTATIDAVEVRGTLPDPAGNAGSALFASSDPFGGGRPSVTVRGSLFSANRSQGVLLDGTDANIEATLVRDTQPQTSDEGYGDGLLAQPDPKTGEPSKLQITSSVIEHCHDIGILAIFSEITVDATVVRDMLPLAANMTEGRGFHVESMQTDLTKRSTLVLRDSLIDGAIDVGVFLVNSDATIERTLVRDTQPRVSDGTFGDGLAIIPAGGSATATISASRFEGQPRAGVSNFGGDVNLGGTRLECNQIHLDGENYMGWTFSFVDAGGNACGCNGASVECKVLTSSLAAPDALP